MEVSAREGVIELGSRITTLRSELQRIKQELRDAEARLDTLMGGKAQIHNSQLDGADETSRNKRIIDLLEANPTRDYSAEEVQKLVGGALTSIRSSMARLANEKEHGGSRIRRSSRGRYQSKTTNTGVAA